ncbi:hypothetical protein DFJ75_3737 [Williamsia muralis]|uniref:Uncharacterized protein n=1 Tax=Williamsia marianensis TaxID=85044 RepID=A0A315SE03_WILMA|nr:hypothetical protein C7458_10856 [Williamsia marianensis]RKR96875.1 hypothetical protein DFJ75_3737 [Williamsia muralis]
MRYGVVAACESLRPVSSRLPMHESKDFFR